jgi:HEAT repeat protein
LLEAAVERLAVADLSTRLMLIQFLGLAAVERSVVPILECARDEAVSEVAMSTLEALGELTEHALDAGWPTLPGDLRHLACLLLARTRGESGSARLSEALEDPDGELRAAAARALGERGAVEVLPDLVRRLEATALDDEPDAADEVDALVDALVVLVGNAPATIVTQAVELLETRMQASSESVRRCAASVFAAIGRTEDVGRMTQLLKDPSWKVRRLAVEGLMRLNTDSSAEPLRLALVDESPLVRVASASAFGCSQGEGVVEDLSRLVADEDPRVRAAALRAIAGHCTMLREAGAADSETESRAIAVLGASLAGDENGGIVRMAALEALDRLGGTDVAVLVASALTGSEPEVVQAAVACIGRHGDKASLGQLIPSVQHPAWAVRAEAIQTLGERHIARALPAILRQLESEQDSFVRDVILRTVRKLEE